MTSTSTEIKKAIKNTTTEKARQQAKTNSFVKNFIITNTQIELNMKAEKKGQTTITTRQIEEILNKMLQK